MSIGIDDVYTSSAQRKADAIALIHRALDLGVNFLDTANIYGHSEAKVGKDLKLLDEVAPRGAVAGDRYSPGMMELVNA